jgi:hypothetical protein
MDPGSSPGVTAEEGGMDPGCVIPDLIRDRGNDLLKNTGQGLSCFWVRLHPVIPAEAEPAPDPGSSPGQARSGGIHIRPALFRHS